MTGGQRRIVLVLILAAAGLLRWDGLDWDQGQHLHPDERFLTMVATSIELPGSLGEYLDASRSPLNPANRGYRFFPYGTVPLFLVRALGEWTGLEGYASAHLLGRFLAGLFDLGTVWLVYRIGLLVAGSAPALVAAALVALSVASIQQAHFFTVDAFGTFFATAGFLAVARLLCGGGYAWHLVFGAALGLAAACRINLALVAGAYGLGLLVLAWRGEPWGRIVRGAGVAALLAWLVFRVGQPYAFAGGLLDPHLSEAFRSSLETIRSLVTGAVEYPPGVQWIGRAPIVFPLKNLLLWGIGPVWGALALVGVVRALSFPAGVLLERGGRADAVRVLFVWALAYLAWHGSQFAATVRYFLPLVPLLAIAGALGASAAPRRRLTIALTTLLLAATALWAVAFTAIYRAPHSRVAASQWIFAHVPPGATIGTEHWDDALPLSLRGHDRGVYRFVELPLYDPDDARKRERLVASLDEVDWIVISSRRLYRSIPRAPWAYPLGRRYYELLFSGELGFELARVVTSYPRLGRLELPDDASEEAFTVYDHPKVLILRKTDRYSSAAVARLLGAVRLDRTVRVPPAEASGLFRRFRPTEIPLPGERGVRQAVPARTGTPWAIAIWLVTLEAMAAALFAAFAPRLGRSPALSWGLARCLAWVAIPWAGWMLAATGLLPSTPATARALAGAFLTAGGIAALLQRRRLTACIRAAPRRVLVVEAVFLGGFALFASLRAWNPAIDWGEKPMDFSILNATLRSPWIPPVDPWFAGETLNYPAYGHWIVAFHTAVTGLPPELAFNLAIATVGAALATAAFLLGSHLGRGTASGWVAVLFTVLLGNLAGPRLLLDDPSRAIGFDYFWATSRVLEGTINEFPFWNLLFGDLHAHVLSQPLELLVMLLGVLWATGAIASGRGCGAVANAAVLAWCAGAVMVTSSWSTPVVAALVLGAGLTGWRERGGGAVGLLAVLAGWAAILVVAVALFLPHWLAYVPPAGSWGFESSAAPLADVLTHFGLFLLAAAPALAARILPSARARPRLATALLVPAIGVVAAATVLRSPAAGLFAAMALLGAGAWTVERDPGLRACAMLFALAGAIGLATEIVWLWDRMNTVFKYYLAMWLLLAPASAVLAWRVRDGALRLVGPAVAIAALAGGVTTVTSAYGFLRSPMAPGLVPTLDGWSHLERRSPDELEAWRWMRREIRGVPVVLEAQGPSYGAFTRVAMNTGLPTVLGWEYHLVQQARRQDDIDERRRDVRTLYETTDSGEAERLLRKYGIDLVVVGSLERETYGAAGLAKFEASGILAPVFRNPSVTIYGTPGILATTKTWIEPLATASPEAPAGRMREPRGVAVGRSGDLWVADFGNGRLQRFDGSGTPQEVLGRRGAVPGEFEDPCGVAIGPDGSLHVADTWNHRVQVLSPDGEPVREWGAGFYGPRGIAVADDGTVYVSDTGRDRIVVATSEGRVLGEWGEGRVPPGFGHPVGIAVQGDEVYVADTDGRRVVVFGRDGRFRRSWPVAGWQADPIEPFLDVGPDGAVWVTDPPGGRVLVFSGAGDLLEEMRSPDLEMPTGIAVLDARRAVAVSTGANRLTFLERR